MNKNTNAIGPIETGFKYIIDLLESRNLSKAEVIWVNFILIDIIERAIDIGYTYGSMSGRTLSIKWD